MPRRTSRGARGSRLRSWAASAALALGAAASSASGHPLGAQGGLLLQGIADAEFWATDTSSNLLTRNHGHPGGVGRLTLWSAVEPWSGVFVYAEGQAEGGNARDDPDDFDAYLDQAGVRYVRSDAFVLDAGKLPSLVGSFASRRFSTRNPLIGEPDGYSPQYPVGLQVSGASRGFDYRAAVVSLPVSHENYVPDPAAAPRPAVGFGYTPMVGVRLGVSGTVGPYLNGDFTSQQLAGYGWRHYNERIGSADAQVSRGYLDVHAEYTLSSYDVPDRPTAIGGATWYADAQYSLAPRLYVAARAERNDYPFVRAAGASSWIASTTDFHDDEVGLGVRLTASTLVKASYRFDHWVITPANRGFLGPGGHAFAVQVSQAFDVMNWVDRR